MKIEGFTEGANFEFFRQSQPAASDLGCASFEVLGEAGAVHALVAVEKFVIIHR